jgi:hypothetical protein
MPLNDPTIKNAKLTGRAERDSYPDLRGSLPQAKKSYLPAVTDPTRVNVIPIDKRYNR